MRYLFMAYHYPRPEYRDELARYIHLVGEALRAQPGLLQLADFDDPANGRVVAISIWESADAFRVGSERAFASLDVKPRYDLWETRLPLEVFTLGELAEPEGA
ncbi:MAG TPA: antibiotic biosynthesis monooxygenase [Ktedonobacterales bacterium]|nr:antibiotic biosynthesis monooxygenase [Ktedonobacterales bacterium]